METLSSCLLQSHTKKKSHHVTPELQEFLEPQQTLSNLFQSLTYRL